MKGKKYKTMDDGSKCRKISYARLFSLMHRMRLNKKSLQEKAGISGSTMRKLCRDENVEVNVLVKICNALQCDIKDIASLEDVE